MHGTLVRSVVVTEPGDELENVKNQEKINVLDHTHRLRYVHQLLVAEDGMNGLSGLSALYPVEVVFQIEFDLALADKLEKEIVWEMLKKNGIYSNY